MKLAQTKLSELANGGMSVVPASWSAPAERSGDGAFARQDAPEDSHTPGQSGVALRLPPQSKIASVNLGMLCRRGIFGIQRKDAKAQRRQGKTFKKILAALRLCALALKDDVAPTELRDFLVALTTKISRLRRLEMALERS